MSGDPHGQFRAVLVEKRCRAGSSRGKRAESHGISNGAYLPISVGAEAQFQLITFELSRGRDLTSVEYFAGRQAGFVKQLRPLAGGLGAGDTFNRVIELTAMRGPILGGGKAGIGAKLVVIEHRQSRLPVLGQIGGEHDSAVSGRENP